MNDWLRDDMQHLADAGLHTAIIPSTNDGKNVVTVLLIGDGGVHQLRAQAVTGERVSTGSSMRLWHDSSKKSNPL